MMRLDRSALFAAAFLGAVSGSVAPASTAAAQTSDPLDWQDEWRRYGAVDAGVTVGLATAGLLVRWLWDPDPGPWDAGILFDDPVRDGLRLDLGDARRRARTVSDWTLLTTLAWPVADSLALWGRGHGDAGLQLFGVTTMSFAGAYLLTNVVKRLVGRARPYSRECDLPDYDHDEDCADRDRYRSFYSGHAAFAFTGASLVCTSHRHLPIYGARGADIAACASAMAVATTTALLRILGDAHYTTDVMTGAVIGVLAGFVLPSLLYFGFDGDGPPGG